MLFFSDIFAFEVLNNKYLCILLFCNKKELFQITNLLVKIAVIIYSNL
jgi:hypothetical protein